MSRIDKVNNSIKREISQIIQEELKDPRVGFVTITRVQTTKDLSLAKVFFSVLGSSVQADKVQDGLSSSAGFIRRLLAQRLRIRKMPELTFKLDKSVEYSIDIMKKIEELRDESKEDSSSN
jgi:ribosome-binding factor A